MKTLIKFTSASSFAAILLALPSCNSFKTDDQGFDAPDAPGVPTTSNPYGVPQAPAGEYGNYVPSTPAPYQSPPSIPGTQSIPEPVSPNSYGNTGATSPSGNVITHTVVKDDTLWGLSKKYNTSVDSIRQANGLSGDLIKLGQEIQIPQ